MERDLGSSIASPVFLQQSIPGRCWDAGSMARKRDLTWQNPDIVRQTPIRNWNPSVWDWDSVGFSAKPSATTHLGSQEVLEPAKDAEGEKVGEEEDQNLTLKLGGTAYSAEEPRPTKRVRSGSPGSYPACQVDDCRADLSNAKDYHKRHKVCEQHSKASKAIVGKQMQRFCQQCSRFHLLSEFDERKRSCRRRLAGHNRRRRKTQPDDMSTSILPIQDQTNFVNGNLDPVNFLTKMADTQCNGEDKLNAGPSISNRDQLTLVSKIQSLPVTSSILKLQEVVGFDLNLSQISKQALLEDLLKASGNLTCSSRKDLPMTVAAALGVSAADSLSYLLRLSSDSGRDDKSKMVCAEPVADDDLHSQPMQLFPSAEVSTKTSAFHPNFESSKPQFQEIDSSLSLQLFSSDEDNCIAKSKSPEKYFSSESSNPTTDTSPSSSPPVMNSFLQLNTEPQNSKHEIISITEDCNAAANGSASHMPSVPFDLFKDSNGQSQNAAVQDIPCPAGYSSSSRSDHSPSTSNSYAEEQTRRIIFKLFDKDPSNFPGNLRAEIFSWLSNRPLEMESYIRPGCVVLSIYLCMLHKDWDELDKDFRNRVFSLINHSKSGFWGSARFLVRANGQIASHRDGKARVWRASSAPELISVSPVAIINGEETTLVLRGRNLTFPGTRIHCTYKGGYTSTKVVGSSYTGVLYDFISQSFSVHVGPCGFFGRCFIEVENGFKGNSFPVIIANSSICQELRVLEAEFQEDRQLKEAVHFLNELGWLFQRKNDSSSCFRACFSTTRSKFLLLFSVERDWLALTKTLLDILVENTSKEDGLMQEFVEMLSDVQLLSRAVKRKCRKMIDLLLHYTFQSNISGSEVYLFPPNMSGPCGMTPLHIIASMLNSEDIVDALTSDPQDIGLSCWSSTKDDSGYSPLMYASMRNNHSYNSLVARKLEDKENGQISIAVDSEKPQLRSCSQCASVQTRQLMRVNHNRGLLKHPFMYPMLAIAAVCVCVCLFYRGAPQIENPEIGLLVPFKWENLKSGPR